MRPVIVDDRLDNAMIVLASGGNKQHMEMIKEHQVPKAGFAQDVRRPPTWRHSYSSLVKVVDEDASPPPKVDYRDPPPQSGSSPCGNCSPAAVVPSGGGGSGDGPQAGVAGDDEGVVLSFENIARVLRAAEARMFVELKKSVENCEVVAKSSVY